MKIVLVDDLVHYTATLKGMFELDGHTVQCPWHGSVFDVRDGALVRGPSAYPQPAWDTRVQNGRIEVRRR